MMPSSPWDGNLVGVHGDACCRDDMAQVGHGGGPKRTLGTFEVQAVGAKSVEDDDDVLQVFRPGGTIDQDIIEKHQHEPAEIWAEDVVHQRLERGRGIGEAKRHHQ